MLLLLLLQVPPVTVLVSIVVVPIHPVAEPPIAAGVPFMVTTVLAVQYVPAAVNVILAVPAFTPVTIPVEDTVAIDVLPLVHE
jgi:hypothetical protein